MYNKIHKNDMRNIIISEKDQNAPFFHPIDYYVFGGNGFIGSIIMDSLKEKEKSIYKTKLRFFFKKVSFLENQQHTNGPLVS